MAKVRSVGGLGKFATAGLLLAAGVAANRLFRPFSGTKPRTEWTLESSRLLTLPPAQRHPIAGPVDERARTTATTRPSAPTSAVRPVRPPSAVLTRRGASRKAWRCV